MTDALADALAHASLEESGSLGPDAPPSTRAVTSSSQTSTELVRALQRASESGPKGKRLIRSTVHYVAKAAQPNGAKQAPADQQPYALVSWKTAEFAYRKSAGLSSELPTLARGLFTEQVGDEEHRIVVRGYDKFFNVGELPWTKPTAIKRFSTPPYHLTFKENGCIIFIAALSPTQLVVTSKHSLGIRDDVEMSHAVKGEEWLLKHLAAKGRRPEELAAELWRRNETAVCELCDDSFEEHVIAYTREKSGLHLHGLNLNQPRFATRPMAEVDNFAREWGFIPTRWLELNSMQEVDRLTEEISRTGSWKGEAIEGFVVRTHMPSELPANTSDGSTSSSENRVARPPYQPGQEWFYKIKFDEPYLMYRDWRELTRRLLKEKKDFETKHKPPQGTVTDSEAASPTPSKSQEAAHAETTTKSEEDAVEPATSAKSKKERQKEKKALAQEQRKAAALAERAAAAAASTSRPPRPELRFKRPKTVLYVEWAYNLLYGSSDGSIKPQPQMFEKFNQGKGIIALREAFLAYLTTPEGAKRLRDLGGFADDADATIPGAGGPANFDKTVIVPIGVPGCGKTSLFVALREIFGWGHTQSDDVQTKRTGPQFLANIEHELGKHDVVIADRNNHLFKHRAEIVGVVENVKKRGTVASGSSTAEQKQPQVKGKGRKSDKKQASNVSREGAAQPQRSLRIRLIALTWAFDSHALNDVHRICSQRIIKRGDNHQSLRFEGAAAATANGASKRSKLSHELILWNFLKELQPFGSSLGGEGDEGQADELFDHTIKLEVEYDQERALRTAISALTGVLEDVTQPSEAQIRAGLDAARGYKVGIRKDVARMMGPRASGAGAKTAAPKPRYYALSVDEDPEVVVRKLIAACPDAVLKRDAQRALERLREGNRIIRHPHITLVHNKSVEAEAKGDSLAHEGDGVGAKARWDKYEQLCKAHDSFQRGHDGDEGEDEDGAGADRKKTHPLAFTFTIDKLVWNDRLMVLGVRDVACAQVPEFARLQGGRGGFEQGKWRPHITLGTARDEIRPFEANEALRLAESGAEKALLIDAGEGGVRSGGRLQGMWT